MQLCATHPRRSCLGLVEAARPRPGLATFNAVHPRRPHRRRWRCFDPLTGPRSEGPGLPQPLFTAEARLGRVRPDFLPNRHRSQLDRRQALQASGRGRTVRCNAFDELKTFLFKMSEKRVNRMSCLHVIYPSLGACPGFDEPPGVVPVEVSPEKRPHLQDGCPPRHAALEEVAASEKARCSPLSSSWSAAVVSGQTSSLLALEVNCSARMPILGAILPTLGVFNGAAIRPDRRLWGKIALTGLFDRSLFRTSPIAAIAALGPAPRRSPFCAMPSRSALLAAFFPAGR